MAQYLIESFTLARSILLGALRWMKPKKTSASLLLNTVDALLVLSDSATGEAKEFCNPNPTFWIPSLVTGNPISVSGVPSPVINGTGYVQSVAGDENVPRGTKRLSVFVVNAGWSGEIGDGSWPVASAGVRDETTVVAGLELLFQLPKQELPRLLSIRVGKILLIKGFSVGMQAQTIPTLTSTALHINDIEACQAKSTSSPSRGNVALLETPEDCWR